MMKLTDSGGISWMHFWITWLPCMLSMQPMTFSWSLSAIRTWSQRGTDAMAFCTTRQPCWSVDRVRTFGSRSSSSAFFWSAVPMSKNFWMTKLPKASLASVGACWLMMLSTSCLSSGLASSSFDCRYLLPLWSCANSRRSAFKSLIVSLILRPDFRTSMRFLLMFGSRSSAMGSGPASSPLPLARRRPPVLARPCPFAPGA
mmetsp:Transcript_23745/g.70697  ORF Transcript_23745/g.70697 Transcript_23745/m.70697 type:complete len:201 (-) Transcript_23745:641-1243(-)